MSTLSVIVVAYNSAETLAACVRSIPSSAELILVDQQSADASIEVTVATRPDARVLRSGGNRGYGAGCNLGAANATGDVLIFLNPDACLLDGAADTMCRSVNEHSGGLIAPLLYESGLLRPTARNWSSALRDAVELLLPARYIPNNLRSDIPITDHVYRQGGQVPYVQGACMAISRDRFMTVGGFDEEYFLYREEESLAHRLALLGVPRFVDPRAAVTHVGKTSTEKVRLFAVRQYYRSRALFYRERTGLLRAIPRVILLAGCILLLWISTPLRVLVAYRPDKGADWCRAALAGLCDGLLRRRARPPAQSWPSPC